MKTLKNVKVLFTVLLTAAMLFCAVLPVFAASAADTNEFIDPEKECSLKLTYAVDSVPCVGMDIEIFRVATVSNDFKYAVSEDFKDLSVKLTEIKTQQERKILASTFGAYITADKVKPTETASTDEKGFVEFKNLKTGLYLVRWTGNPVAGNFEGFDPFIISLPTLEDGETSWKYDVEAFPKGGGNVAEPEEETYKVLKEWNDNSDKKRPALVNIEIYCDGELYKEVTLNKENNWAYTWKSEGKHVWTAVERNIPENYTVTVDDNTATIIVKNTFDNPLPPQPTGDTSKIVLYVVLAAVAGAALIVLAILAKKSKKEE